MNNKVVNAGIRLTRNCNMKCMYCNIQNTHREDLNIEEWKRAVLIIKELGAKNLVLLGGEPTLYPDVVELVEFAAKNGLCVNMTTNALSNYNIIERLLEVGLNKIGISIDNLDLKKSISPYKAKKGLELLEHLLKKGLGNKIVDYMVLSKKNVEEIEELIKYMSNLGVTTYILPYHWGNEGTFDHRKNENVNAFTTEEDLRKYVRVIDELITMKEQGYLISNSKKFLEDSKKYILNLNWKCDGLSELRIDSDGKMVCCCDKLGKVNENFTIFDLPDKLKDFYVARQLDAQNCDGCLWPSSYEAEYERKNK